MRKLCRLWKDVSVANGKFLSFFENKDCKYFPCHKGLADFNCLFCYCPMYRLEHCPGNPRYFEKMADGSRIARAAPSRMIRSIMIRSCRFCGRIRHCPTAAAKMVAGPAGDYSAGIHPSSPTRTFSLEKYVSTSGFTRHLERGLRPEQSAPGPKFPYSI